MRLLGQLQPDSKIVGMLRETELKTESSYLLLKPVLNWKLYKTHQIIAKSFQNIVTEACFPFDSKF